MMAKLSFEEFMSLVRQKKFCPHCKEETGEDVKLEEKMVEDKEGKRVTLTCPRKHGSLYRVERLT